MLPEYFIYIAASIRILAGLLYIKSILKGKTRPSAVSWLIWSVSPFIAFFAATFSEGFKLASLVTLALGISPLLVFITASVTKNHLFKFTLPDLICGILAIISLICWLITKNPILTISFAILADLISTVPTLKKSYYYPDTEYAPTYLLAILAMSITLLANKETTSYSLIYPTYILLMNLLVASIIITRKNRNNKNKKKQKEKNNKKRKVKLKNKIAKINKGKTIKVKR